MAVETLPSGYRGLTVIKVNTYDPLNSQHVINVIFTKDDIDFSLINPDYQSAAKNDLLLFDVASQEFLPLYVEKFDPVNKIVDIYFKPITVASGSVSYYLLYGNSNPDLIYDTFVVPNHVTDINTLNGSFFYMFEDFSNYTNVDEFVSNTQFDIFNLGGSWQLSDLAWFQDASVDSYSNQGQVLVLRNPNTNVVNPTNLIYNNYTCPETFIIETTFKSADVGLVGHVYAFKDLNDSWLGPHISFGTMGTLTPSYKDQLCAFGTYWSPLPGAYNQPTHWGKVRIQIFTGSSGARLEMKFPDVGFRFFTPATGDINGKYIAVNQTVNLVKSVGPTSCNLLIDSIKIYTAPDLYHYTITKLPSTSGAVNIKYLISQEFQKLTS